MFNIKKIKELRQRIKDLEKSCKDLEIALKDWKEKNEKKDMKITELEYRLKLADKEKIELNNVISNLMEDKNKLTAKKIRKAKKVEVITSDETK